MANGEFSKETKLTLGHRVGLKCSKCRKLTSGPHSQPDKRVLDGEACHIRARMAGEARYDPNMTDEQRSDIRNGIWLCTGCHTLVDRDEKRYSVELLERLKSAAEDDADQERQGQHRTDSGSNNTKSTVINVGTNYGQVAEKITNNYGYRGPQRTLADRTISKEFLDRMRATRITRVKVVAYSNDGETRAFAASIVDALVQIGLPCERVIDTGIGGNPSRITIYSHLSGETDPLFWFAIWLDSEGFETDYRNYRAGAKGDNSIEVHPQT